MNKIQKRQQAFFQDDRRFTLYSERRGIGRTWYTQTAKQALRRKAEAMQSKDSLGLVVVDECAEMTMEDFDKLRDHPALTGGDESIQTSRHNDWFFRRFIAAGRGSKASMAAEIPVNDEEGGYDANVTEH